MANSPSRHTPHVSATASASTTHLLGSPRSTRSLRKLQSAHALSTSYAASNTPSLISQQRQQQQQQQQPPPPQQQQQLQQRSTGLFQNNGLPPVPPLPNQSSHHRARSNSDALSPSPSHIGAVPAKKIVPPRRTVVVQSPKDELEALMRHGPRGDVPTGLQRLRHLILCDGLDADSDGMSPLRIYIWLILLNSPPLSTDTYLELIRRGASPAYAKIRNDTFRTLATNPLFKRRVSEASLIRLLNAVAWRLHDAKAERMTDGGRTVNSSSELGSPELQHTSPLVKHAQGASTVPTEGSEVGGAEPGIYVQGMNVLCAPFLYAARSEAEAFVAFHRFITRECPGYVRGAMDGVHKGLVLVDKCLAIVDPKLAQYLRAKGMTAEIYAFASVLTMCACTPPLPEVLQLWDFLFAYGPHLNILCICAQLLMMKDTLLGSPSPTKLLRSFPPLQAKKIIELTLNWVRKIPVDVYEELVHHAE